MNHSFFAFGSLNSLGDLQNIGDLSSSSVRISGCNDFSTYMTSLSSGESQLFGPSVHGPRTREIATPPDLPLNSPSPANIGDLRLPVSVEVSVSKIEGLLSRPI